MTLHALSLTTLDLSPAITQRASSAPSFLILPYRPSSTVLNVQTLALWGFPPPSRVSLHLCSPLAALPGTFPGRAPVWCSRFPLLLCLGLSLLLSATCNRDRALLELLLTHCMGRALMLSCNL